MKVQMMSNKLTAEKMGITAANAFILDKSFCLSLVTTLLSYYIVLSRLKSNTAPSDCLN